jgi:hypothetical protein
MCAKVACRDRRPSGLFPSAKVSIFSELSKPKTLFLQRFLQVFQAGKKTAQVAVLQMVARHKKG